MKISSIWILTGSVNLAYSLIMWIVDIPYILIMPLIMLGLTFFVLGIFEAREYYNRTLYLGFLTIILIMETIWVFIYAPVTNDLLYFAYGLIMIGSIIFAYAISSEWEKKIKSYENNTK